MLLFLKIINKIFISFSLFCFPIYTETANASQLNEESLSYINRIDDFSMAPQNELNENQFSEEGNLTENSADLEDFSDGEENELNQVEEEINEKEEIAKQSEESEILSLQEESGVAIVRTVAEIKSALANSSIHTIQLASDIEGKVLDIKGEGINITRSITIDGNGSIS